MIETIENGFWRLSIAPALGASVTALEARVDDGWQPLMRPATGLEGISSSPFSSYTLAPYSNRIRGSHFEFRGQQFALEPNNSKGETIHGDVRNRPWAVTRASDSRLECHFDSRSVDNANFPFAYAVAVTYSLEGAICRTSIILENVGDVAMPAGFGFHPYFVRRFAGSLSDPLLEFSATGYYVTDELTIPTEGAHGLTSELDFSSAKNAYAAPLDTVFNGWGGRAALIWDQHRLELIASDVFTHFVAFNGGPDGTVALEPVTHATDGFNLLARGVENTGVRILEPLEELTGDFTLQLHAL
jgi:aldose 1-epimerase